MPGFDGTGPLGEGPLTGRGMGYCVIRIPDNEKTAPARDFKVGGKYAENLVEKGKEVIPMPAGSKTDPPGYGAMRGPAAGYYAGYPMPGYAGPAPGRSFSVRSGYPALMAPGYGYATNPQAFVPVYVPAVYPFFWGRPFGFRPNRRFGRGRARRFGRGYRWMYWY